MDRETEAKYDIQHLISTIKDDATETLIQDIFEILAELEGSEANRVIKEVHAYITTS